MITIEEIRDQLKEVLVRHFPQVADSVTNFSDETPLRSASLELDSIDLLLLVLEIEKKFAIRLVSDEFDETTWTNLNTLAQQIQERMLRSQPSPNKV